MKHARFLMLVWTVVVSLVAAELRRQALPFRQVGLLYVSQATVRVRLKFDLSAFGEVCDQLLALDRGLFRAAAPIPADEYMKKTFDLLASQAEKDRWDSFPDPDAGSSRPEDSVWLGLEEACAQVDSWPTSYGLYARDDQGRHERGPLIMGALMGYGLAMTASLVVSSLGLGGSDADLTATVRQQGEEIELLASRVGALGEWRAHAELRLTILEVQRAVADVTQGLSTLVTGRRMTSSLLPAVQLRRLWTMVEDLVDTLGGEVQLPFAQGTALYEFPASFVLEEGHLVAEVFVPLVTERMRLFWREDFPLALEQGDAATLVRRQHEEYLAVGDRQTLFVTLSEAELGRCHQQQRRYFCGVAAIRRDFDESCEASLFLGQLEGVASQCVLTAFTRSWAVWRSADRTFHLYTRDSLRATVLCLNGTQRLDVYSPGFHLVQMSASCALSTELFYLPREVEYVVETSMSSPLLPSVEGLKRAVTENEDIAALRRDIAEMRQQRQGGGGSVWVVVVAVVSGMLALVVAGVCMYFLYIFRSAQKAV